MLYLNIAEPSSKMRVIHLTLTNVVFEFLKNIMEKKKLLNLTLTNVVFESQHFIAPFFMMRI